MDFEFTAVLHNQHYVSHDFLEISFPTTKDQIELAFNKLRINPQEPSYFIDEFKCSIPDIVNKLDEHYNLTEINYLASVLKDVEPSDYDILAAAVNEDICDVEKIINIALNVQDGNIPYINASNEEELGRYIVEDAQGLHAAELPTINEIPLIHYLDYEDIGRDYAINERGNFYNDIFVKGMDLSLPTYYDGPEDIEEEYSLDLRPDPEVNKESILGQLKEVAASISTQPASHKSKDMEL